MKKIYNSISKIYEQYSINILIKVVISLKINIQMIILYLVIKFISMNQKGIIQ